MDVLSGIFHHGVIVDDIESAMADLGRSAGVAWAPVRVFDPLPVWTPDSGRGEAKLKVAYSRRGPLHLELVEAAAGSPYDLLRTVDRSHLGVWVDSVGDAVDALCQQGWRLLMSGASDKHRYGSMAYLVQDGGPVIEVVGRNLQPMMEAWWSA